MSENQFTGSLSFKNESIFSENCFYFNDVKGDFDNKAIPPFNELIKLVLDTDLDIRQLINQANKPKQFFFTFNETEITKFIIFEDKIIHRVLVVTLAKTSFHDVEKVPLLYDIVFHTLTESVPKIKVFRLEHQKLRVIHFENLTFVSKNGLFETYTCFNNTAIQLSITLFHSTFQTAITIQDKSNKTLLTATSAEMTPDLIFRLRAYLELLFYEKRFLQLKEFIESQTIKLMKIVEESPQYHDRAIQAIASDPVGFKDLLRMKLQLYKERSSIEVKKLVEEILYKGFSFYTFKKVKVDGCEFIDQDTLLFHTNRAIDEDEKDVNLKIVKTIDSSSQNFKEETIKTFEALQKAKEQKPQAQNNLIDILYFETQENTVSHDDILKILSEIPDIEKLNLRMVYITLISDAKPVYYSFKYDAVDNFTESHQLYYIHPFLADIIEVQRLEDYIIDHDTKNSTDSLYLFYVIPKNQPKLKEYRLLSAALVNKKSVADTNIISFLELLNLEEDITKLCEAVKKSLEENASKKTYANQMFFQILPILETSEIAASTYFKETAEKYIETFKELHIEKVIFKFKINDLNTAVGYHTYLLEIKKILSENPDISVKNIRRFDRIEYLNFTSHAEHREIQATEKGSVWAYRIPEFISKMAYQFRVNDLGITEQTEDEFIELDLDHASIVIDQKTYTVNYNFGELIPVTRPFGFNESGIVVGLKTDNLHIGKPVKRLLIIGDLSHASHGTVRAQECARINAAIHYAAREKIPIDWFTASYGVEIHREKGVESLDAAASTVREIVKYCHNNGVTINLIIDETNLGAQSYWDSLATLLQMTKGIIIMTPRGCMALTGPNALVSALYKTSHSLEIPTQTKSLYPLGLQSLSGHELVHGPNGESMLLASNFEEACLALLRHHYYSYIEPHEKISTNRNLTGEQKGTTISSETIDKEIENLLKGFKPNREIILEYLRDKGSPTPLRFWKDSLGTRGQPFKNGDLVQTPSTIVQEMLIGGFPTMVIFTPIGPLTPADSDIISKAIYKANGSLQLLIIGSLTGFTSDPLSMENHQLQAGAWIAKAIVEFTGPILIVNLGIIVGGTFVVFNRQLNPNVRIIAIEGSQVQVIGGKSAAKVVFHSQIVKQAEQDPRVVKLAKSDNKEDYQKMRNQVIEELEKKEGALFDQYHSAKRAERVGSIDAIISYKTLRESILDNFKEMRPL